MSNIDRAAEILHRHHDNCNDAADALDAAGLLMPDTPGKPDAWGKWDVNGLEVNAADKDGEVRIEWEEESDYAYYGPQTRTLWLSRDQVTTILAAADYAEGVGTDDPA